MSTFGTDLYKGTSSLGRFTSTVRFYISIVIAIILIAIGIWFFSKKEDNLVDTYAIIKKVNCLPFVNDKKTISYNCMVDIEYTVNNKVYNGKLNLTNYTPYMENQSVPITYDINNPYDYKSTTIKSKWIGLILMGIAIIVVGVGYYMKYLAAKYEVAAAATGATDVLNIVSAPFRR